MLRQRCVQDVLTTVTYFAGQGSQSMVIDTQRRLDVRFNVTLELIQFAIQVEIKIEVAEHGFCNPSASTGAPCTIAVRSKELWSAAGKAHM